MKKNKIIIIGGGPSGIMSAIFAKKSNKNNEVIIIDKNEKLGKKILVTGNGRCNLTNRNLKIDRYHTNNNKKLIEKVLVEFSNIKTIEFFEKFGIIFKEEENGKIFPTTDNANSIIEILKSELEDLNIKILLNTEVIDIEKKDDIFKLKIHDVGSKNKKEIDSDKLVIATGGLAYPQLGANNSGYIFAQKFDHKIEEQFPSLVPLKLECDYLKKISGVKFFGTARIENNKKSMENTGDLLFTDYGISGLCLISISRFATKFINENKKDLNINLDFIPNLNAEKIFNHFLQIKKINKNKTLKLILSGLINPKLVNYLFYKIDLNKKLGEIEQKEFKEIVNIIKNTKYKIIGHKGFEHAQVTAGGVDLSEINESTLESKKIKNLFFCGEVLDVDGDSGGFNLQWAISSGFVVGKSI